MGAAEWTRRGHPGRRVSGLMCQGERGCLLRRSCRTGRHVQRFGTRRSGGGSPTAWLDGSRLCVRKWVSAGYVLSECLSASQLSFISQRLGDTHLLTRGLAASRIRARCYGIPDLLHSHSHVGTEMILGLAGWSTDRCIAVGQQRSASA